MASAIQEHMGRSGKAAAMAAGKVVGHEFRWWATGCQ